MKRITLFFIILFIIFSFNIPSFAQFYGPDQTVQGYAKQDGTLVQPYHRTVPDHDLFNNYSTRDNTNPYTGQMGQVDPYRQQQNNSFSFPSSQRQPRRFGP